MYTSSRILWFTARVPLGIWNTLDMTMMRAKTLLRNCTWRKRENATVNKCHGVRCLLNKNGCQGNKGKSPSSNQLNFSAETLKNLCHICPFISRINLRSSVDLWVKRKSVTIQIIAMSWTFLFWVALAISKCDHSNESYWAVLSLTLLITQIFYVINFFLLWYCLLRSTRPFYVWINR